ncbi:tyrosine-type recombinase/integrase [Streptosporangium sp. NPDC001681]|uniref:tyrosine-type recombinase/integrase n=1 Tax=Streptosporangium sp. NPDC001681 TaxID=3154395 RepID=UPI00331BCCAD
MRIGQQSLEGAGVIPVCETGTRRWTESREEGFHALRHHFASVLLADGVDIRSLAEFLGHEDPGFTLRTYTHFMPSGEVAHAKGRRACPRRRDGQRPFTRDLSALYVPWRFNRQRLRRSQP